MSDVNFNNNDEFVAWIRSKGYWGTYNDLIRNYVEDINFQHNDEFIAWGRAQGHWGTYNDIMKKFLTSSFTPLDVFSGSELGFWLDIPNYTYVDSGGGPLATSSEKVGLVLDRSPSVTLGDNLAAILPTPSISNSSGSLGTWEESTLTMRNTAIGTNGDAPRFSFNLGLTIGKRYYVKCVLSGDIDKMGTVTPMRLAVSGGNNTVPYNSTTGVFDGYQLAASNNMLIHLDGRSISSVRIVSIEVREAFGLHATQVTTGNKPTLTGSSLIFDGVDDYLRVVTPSMGSNVTIGYSDPVVGAKISMRNTISSGNYDWSKNTNNLVVVDRNLNTLELKGLQEFLNEKTNGSLYKGLTGTFNYYIDAALGNDANDGLTSGTPWKTLSKIASVMSGRSGVTTRVLVKSGTYDTALDYVNVSVALTAITLLDIVFEPGCTMDGTAANVISSTNGFEFAFGTEAWRATIYGNGLKINNYTHPSASSPNGVGNRSFTIVTAHNVHCTNCEDGFSSHEDGQMYIYDSSAVGGVKSAFAHIDRTNTRHYRCYFEADSGALLGLGTINDTNSIGYFEDCIFVPATSGQKFILKNTTLVRCQVGTMDKSVELSTQTTSAVPMTISDSFINMYADGATGATLLRCFGKFSARIRTGGNQSIKNCVFVAPATGKGSIFFSNYSSGGAQTLVSHNNIYVTDTAIAFMDVDSTNASYMVTANNEFFNNILYGSAAFDDDLITADSLNAVRVGNLTSNPLLGSADTLDMINYSFQAGSPAVGAGVAGVDIGFSESNSVYKIPQLVI